MMTDIFNESYVINKILSCDFEEARKIIDGLPYEDLENLLLKIGFDYGQSMVIYSFICYLIKCKECIEYHCLAQSVLCGPLCHIKGAYKIALYHNCNILNIEQNNLQAKVMMLFYNTLPEPLITDGKAMQYAKEILDVDPNNSVALNYIKTHEYV